MSTPVKTPDVDTVRQIVRALHARRRAHNISRTEIARRMGTTRGVVRRLEDTDQGGLQLHTLTRYARACDAELGFALSMPDAPDVTIVMPSPRRAAKRRSSAR